MSWNSSGGVGLRCDVLHRQNIVDGCPIGIVDHGMPIIILRLPCRGPAGDDAHRIDIDIPARLLRQRLHAADVARRFLERDAARYRRKKRVAISDRECLAGRRRAGIHDQRTRPAIGFRLRPHALQLEEMPIEIETLARRPCQLHDIEPFLRVFVARLVIAQCRAEHLELALVPAAHEIQPKRPSPMWSAVTNSLAAISGEISGACTVPNTVSRSVLAKSPQAQATVSHVAPW